jgi:hypothetical protein
MADRAHRENCEKGESMSRTLKVLISVTALLLVFSTSNVFAQHAAKGNAGNDDATVGAAGQSVAVDAKGKLRAPTHEEIQALTGAMKLNNSVEGLTSKVVGNGTVMVDLQGRFESVSVAKRNPDGSISKACVVSAKEAEQFLKSEPSKAKEQPKAKTDSSTWEVK